MKVWFCSFAPSIPMGPNTKNTRSPFCASPTTVVSTQKWVRKAVSALLTLLGIETCIKSLRSGAMLCLFLRFLSSCSLLWKLCSLFLLFSLFVQCLYICVYFCFCFFFLFSKTMATLHRNRVNVFSCTKKRFLVHVLVSIHCLFFSNCLYVVFLYNMIIHTIVL